MKCNTKEAFKLFVKDMLPKFIKYSLRAITLCVFLLFSYGIVKFNSAPLGEYTVDFIIIVGVIIALGCSIFLFIALFSHLKTLYFEFKNYINNLCKLSLLVNK